MEVEHPPVCRGKKSSKGAICSFRFHVAPRSTNDILCVSSFALNTLVKHPSRVVLAKRRVETPNTHVELLFGVLSTFSQLVAWVCLSVLPV